MKTARIVASFCVSCIVAILKAMPVRRIVFPLVSLSTMLMLVMQPCGATPSEFENTHNDPAGGSWTGTSRLIMPRYSHTATLLRNGKVLVAAGYDDGSFFASSELYDPANGTVTWTSTGSLNQSREFHTATLLPNGKVLAAGGLHESTVLASAELYDPASGAWAATGSL